MPLRIVSRLDRFAHAGWAITQANIALALAGIAELHKAAVFLGDQEIGRLVTWRGFALSHFHTVSASCDFEEAGWAAQSFEVSRGWESTMPVTDRLMIAACRSALEGRVCAAVSPG